MSRSGDNLEEALATLSNAPAEQEGDGPMTTATYVRVSVEPTASPLGFARANDVAHCPGSMWISRVKNSYYDTPVFLAAAPPPDAGEVDRDMEDLKNMYRSAAISAEATVERLTVERANRIIETDGLRRTVERLTGELAAERGRVVALVLDADAFRAHAEKAEKKLELIHDESRPTEED